MNSTVVLEVVEGSMKGERFLFRETAGVLVGRSRMCDIQLPDDPLHWDVSRKHCLIDVSPPRPAIRDVGSRNGTYVNGISIGQRAACLRADDALARPSPPLRLCDGDLIRVGGTVFRVDLHALADEAENATEPLHGDPVLAGAQPPV
jgi:eukaryotic-like serine/threonine-protein kinase